MVTITFNGETLRLSEWATKTGLTPDCIRARLKKGWPVEKVLAVTEGRAPTPKEERVIRKGDHEELPARNWMTGL